MRPYLSDNWLLVAAVGLCFNGFSNQLVAFCAHSYLFTVISLLLILSVNLIGIWAVITGLIKNIV
ncbi:hypothetical protein [Xanthocytophaga flava]|uniref:hypothetical protein n=1 Tax=Xanthocytophaga flava TaxID=3048013 RepID=UPI0028D6FFF3|nr:hypothetical protein [Xanthocytophaga flavus]